MKRNIANCPKCFSKKTNIYVSSGGKHGEFALYLGKCSDCNYILDSLGEGSESKALTEWNMNAVHLSNEETLPNLGLTKRQIVSCKNKLKNSLGYVGRL